MITYKEELNNTILQGVKVYESEYYRIELEPYLDRPNDYIMSIYPHEDAGYPKIKLGDRLNRYCKEFDYTPDIYLVYDENIKNEMYSKAYDFIKNELKPFVYQCIDNIPDP